MLWKVFFFFWNCANIYDLADFVYAPGRDLLWLSGFTQGADNKWNFATGAEAPEKCIESMTSGFRKVGLSQMRTVLVAPVKGWVLNSVRAEGLKTLCIGLLLHPWSLPFSRERGMGVEGHAPSPNVRRLRGDFHVWRSQILCFREVTYQGQWGSAVEPRASFSHTKRLITHSLDPQVQGDSSHIL